MQKYNTNAFFLKIINKFKYILVLPDINPLFIINNKNQ